MKTALAKSSVRPNRRVASGAKAASSAIFGSAVTLGLFLLVSHFGRQPLRKTVEMEDLRTVYAPIEPPPPPPKEVTTEVPPDVTITGFDIAPSNSEVKITVLPPDLEALLPPPPVAPPAKIDVNRLYTEFKPKLSVGKFEERIYQMSEVDRLPEGINKIAPQIPGRMMRDVEMKHVVILAVVEIDGTPRNLRIARSSGDEEFDRLMMEAIAQWTFAPAVRKGKKVRCLVSEDMHCKKAAGSIFQVQ